MEPKQHVELATELTLPSHSWIEVVAPEPLRTTAYIHQVCFDPIQPYSLADKDMGVVGENGETVSVSVRVHEKKDALDLPLQNYYDSSTICYGIAELELDREFDRVELYASQEMAIENLKWHSTDK